MLDEKQIAILQAIVNTIIPLDDFPAGWEAGVGTYLLHQFEGDLKHLVPQYQQWLSDLDAESQTIYNKPFTELDADSQTNLFEDIEKGEVTSKWDIDPAAFFRVIVEHCAEGFYSNPENGGNKDGIAWQMIGFEVTG